MKILSFTILILAVVYLEFSGILGGDADFHKVTFFNEKNPNVTHSASHWVLLFAGDRCESIAYNQTFHAYTMEDEGMCMKVYKNKNCSDIPVILRKKGAGNFETIVQGVSSCEWGWKEPPSTKPTTTTTTTTTEGAVGYQGSDDFELKFGKNDALATS